MRCLKSALSLGDSVARIIKPKIKIKKLTLNTEQSPRNSPTTNQSNHLGTLFAVFISRYVKMLAKKKFVTSAENG